MMKLGKDNPAFFKEPQIFYKTFLEIDLRNMIHILAFDNQSMTLLLSENWENEQEFLKIQDYPLFYLDKEKESALDSALANHQYRSIQLMIGYIVHH